MSSRRFPFIVLVSLLTAASASAGVNRWTTTGPWGGPVRCAARDPSNPSLLYAGTEHGLYLSRNDGASWSLASSSREGISSIGISVRSPVSVYAITFSGVLWRSRDSGGTWRSSTPFGEDVPRSLVVDILGVVYGAGDGGVWRSTDGGGTWTKHAAGFGEPPFVHDLAVVGQAGLVYAATDRGIFRSGDLGVNWSRASELLARDLDVDQDGVIYAADSSSGVLFSSDGTTWTTREGGIALEPQRLVATSPDGRRLWASNGNRVFEWRDATGWSELPRPAREFGIRSLLGLAEGLVLVSTVDGLFRSRAENGWDLLEEGLRGRLVHDLALDEERGFVYGSGSLSVFRSAGPGQSWTSFPPPGVSAGQCSAGIVGIETMRTPQGLAIYAATSGGFSRGCGVPSGGLLRSFDDGVSWTRAESLGVIGSLAVEPTEHRYSYMSVFSCQLFPPPTSCAATLIYASEDGGDTWTFQSHQPLGLSMFVVSVDPNDPRIVYAWSYDGLMRSSDSGRTWSETAEINGPTTVLVSPSNPSNVFAATNSGAFYRSGDRGLTWQRTAADPPAPILALAEDPRDPEVLMAGTDGAGVVRSKDAGETWAPDNRGIENLTVYALLFEAEGRILHAATESGVFSRETPAPRVISHR